MTLTVSVCTPHPTPKHQEAIKVVGPVIMGKMIQYFENYDPNNMTALYETLGYAAALSLCTFGLALLHHLYFYHVQRAGMKIRVAMCHMIYKKVSMRANYYWPLLNSQVIPAFQCGKLCHVIF